MASRWKRGLGIVTAGAVAALVAGSAVALAEPAKAGAAARHTVHADIGLIRADGSSDAFSVDQGKLTAESDASITLERADGKSVTLAMTPGTRIRGELQVGRRAAAFSRGGRAFAVFGPRRTVAVAHLGAQRMLPGVVHADVSLVHADGSSASFSYDRGRVAARTDMSVTLERRDGESVTLGVVPATWIRGRVGVGSRAMVFSRGGTALAILAAAPKV